LRTSHNDTTTPSLASWARIRLAPWRIFEARNARNTSFATEVSCFLWTVNLKEDWKDFCK
jgi:hypothetical protein